MEEYKGLIGRIRGYRGEVDFDRMLSRVERRILRRRAGMKLALAGALALMLFAFASYFYYPTRQAANGGTLMSYVFEQESVDGPILDYVFSRNGTIFD